MYHNLQFTGSENYDYLNLDHKLYLAAEARALGITSRTELLELSVAMTRHEVKLLHLSRAIRNYVDNPFGKYFCKEREHK